jgi:hypothetical protein
MSAGQSLFQTASEILCGISSIIAQMLPKVPFNLKVSVVSPGVALIPPKESGKNLGWFQPHG